MPINGTTISKDKSQHTIHITRASGDRHRWSSSTHEAFNMACTPGGQTASTASARPSLQVTRPTTSKPRRNLRQRTGRPDHRPRLERGMATFELTLAQGRPELMPQSPVRVTGFKEDIDGQSWQVKEVCHTLSDGGLGSKAGAVND